MTDAHLETDTGTGAAPGAQSTGSADPSDTPHGAQHPGYRHDKARHLQRLRRIEGQIRGLQRMVDNEEYCIDVLTQISAATKALQAVALGLVEDHLGHCVIQAAASSPEEGQAKVREAADAIARLVRS